MRVRLTRKLADCLDGVDLRAHTTGDVLDLPAREARLLLAEQWAELASSEAPVAAAPVEAPEFTPSPLSFIPDPMHVEDTDVEEDTDGEIVTS